MLQTAYQAVQLDTTHNPFDTDNQTLVLLGQMSTRQTIQHPNIVPLTESPTRMPELMTLGEIDSQLTNNKAKLLQQLGDPNRRQTWLEDLADAQAQARGTTPKKQLQQLIQMEEQQTHARQIKCTNHMLRGGRLGQSDDGDGRWTTSQSLHKTNDRTSMLGRGTSLIHPSK